MIFKVNDTFNEPFVICNNTYNKFIELSHDKNPMHTDAEFAISKGFKGKIMHGNILNSFISYFIGECLPSKNVLIHSQEIQFKKAMYLNDKINFVARVSGVFESVNVVEFKFEFKKSDFEIIAKGKIQIGLLK